MITPQEFHEQVRPIARDELSKVHRRFIARIDASGLPLGLDGPLHPAETAALALQAMLQEIIAYAYGLQFQTSLLLAPDRDIRAEEFRSNPENRELLEQRMKDHHELTQLFKFGEEL